MASRKKEEGKKARKNIRKNATQFAYGST